MVRFVKCKEKARSLLAIVSPLLRVLPGIKGGNAGIARQYAAGGKALEAPLVHATKRIDSQPALSGVVRQRQKTERAKRARLAMCGGRKNRRYKNAAEPVLCGAVDLGAVMGGGKRPAS